MDENAYRNNKGKYVAIFTTGNGEPIFMTDLDDRPKKFSSEEEAEREALAMPVSVQWPFVVVEIA